MRAASRLIILIVHGEHDIVHFSGHGSNAHEIILQDSSGHSHAVPKAALEKLFKVLKDNIRCVVLNACYSEGQAQGIGEYIDCIVGMSKEIGDESAISFAESFYQGIEKAVMAGVNGEFDKIRNHHMPWGVHRQGSFIDPFGHLWLVGDKSPLHEHPEKW